MIFGGSGLGPYNSGYGGGYGGYGGGYGYEYGCVGYFTVLVIIFGLLICFCCAFSGLGYFYLQQREKLKQYITGGNMMYSSNNGSQLRNSSPFVPTSYNV